MSHMRETSGNSPSPQPFSHYGRGMSEGQAEGLGVFMTDSHFYLGRAYDPNTKTLTNEPVYYDPADLTTHAVVTGMTGSGKTGLCITLLEEAALAGIPAIIIDPK